MQIHLSPQNNDNDGHCASNVDDHWENEMRNADDLMKDTPGGLMIEWKLGDTNCASSFIHDCERPGEDEFVRSREENDGTCNDDETASDVWLFEPLFGEKDGRVDALKGNECGEPEWSASETSQKVSEQFTQDV